MIVKNDANKTVKQIDKVQAEIFFARIGERHRQRVAADPWNLMRRQAETDVRLNSCPMRRAHKWNRMPLSDHKNLEKIGVLKKALRAENNGKSRERGEREHGKERRAKNRTDNAQKLREE
jgi:hypothetical protein